MSTHGGTVRGRRAGAGVLYGVLAVVIAGPAAAAEVRVEGQAVFYKAKVGEVNTVVVTHRVGSGDPGSPGASTIEIKDSTAPISGFGACHANGPDAVVCQVQQPSFVSLDLGNKDDKASQTVVSSGQSLPMRISGGLGNDTLSGGFNGDTIDGGPGTDVIDGDDGDDVLKGGADNDQIRGGRGKDNIDGELGDDKVLDGGTDNDVIHGGSGDDVLTGGPGSDQLFGDAGKDTLNSRDGETDALDCGIGNDTVDRDSSDTTKQCNR
jgi:hypothetical protein